MVDSMSCSFSHFAVLIEREARACALVRRKKKLESTKRVAFATKLNLPLPPPARAPPPPLARGLPRM